VASRLSENPSVRVLLVEAGGDPPQETYIPAAWSNLQLTDADWGFHDSGASPLVREQTNLPQGKALGGSTAINAMCYVRGHPKDYDSWNAPGWSYEDVLPYFQKSECFHASTEAPSDKTSHGTEGPLQVTYRDPFLPCAKAFVEAAQRRGAVHADYNGVERPEKVVNFHQNTITTDGKRHTAYDAFVRPVLDSRPNLTVMANTHASRVIIDGAPRHACTGVEVIGADGETQVLSAGTEVVLACGAYQTPKLMLRSGIGPREELAAAGVECVINSPYVGKNLKDHICTCISVASDAFLSLGELIHGTGAGKNAT